MHSELNLQRFKIKQVLRHPLALPAPPQHALCALTKDAPQLFPPKCPKVRGDRVCKIGDFGFICALDFTSGSPLVRARHTPGFSPYTNVPQVPSALGTAIVHTKHAHLLHTYQIFRRAKLAHRTLGFWGLTAEVLSMYANIYPSL